VRVSIGKKLSLGFLSLALLVGALGFVGYSNLSETGNQTDVIEEESNNLIILNEMKAEILEATEEALAYSRLGDPIEKQQFYSKIEGFDAAAASFVEASSFRQLGQHEETELFDQIIAAKRDVTIAVTTMFEVYEEHGGVDPSYFGLVDQEKHRFVELIDEFLEIESEEVFEAQQEINATIASAKRLAIILVSFAVVLAIGLSLFLSRSISRPIASLRNTALEFGEGHLGVRTAINSSDEIGQLATSFNEMASAIEHSHVQLEQRFNETEEAKRSLESEVVERKEVAAQLSRSNQDLEQFANIASHDLQEPLRMVSSYTQLLERRYKDQLDADANEFIGYAVDGAKRMQSQINDLLTFSRVTTQGNSFEATDCSDVFETTLINLSESIEENGATVTRDSLPNVMADESQLVSVFQNLIGNGIKFHGDEPPRIHVSAVESGDDWLFSFSDNGIGIESEFGERIFQIFQRLHGKTKYPGTRIGLAICKKVVERHGGRIWVESEPGKGSTFYFTITRNQETKDDELKYNTIQSH